MTPAAPPGVPLRASFGEFHLDEANARLLRSGQPVPLPPTPFTLLCALVRQPGKLLTKDALLDAVWGHRFLSESVLKTAVGDLRSALGDDPRRPRFIETVHRRGYRFVAAPAPAPAAAPAPASVPAPAPAHPCGSCSCAPGAGAPLGPTEALSRLRWAWQRAWAGQRALVWVTGESGAGKTTLIDQFAAGLGEVAHAQGDCIRHHGGGEPYLPVLEGVGALCRGDTQVPLLLRAVAPAWLLQLPWLSSPDEREALRRELAGVGPERMLREFGAFLDRYTAQRPLLLVTEDLHWSDPATIRLMDYLARRRGPARFLWVASLRPAEVDLPDHPLHPVRSELRLHGLCEELVLPPRPEGEGAERAGGHEAPLKRMHASIAPTAPVPG